MPKFSCRLVVKFSKATTLKLIHAGKVQKSGSRRTTPKVGIARNNRSTPNCLFLVLVGAKPIEHIKVPPDPAVFPLSLLPPFLLAAGNNKNL